MMLQDQGVAAGNDLLDSGSAKSEAALASTRANKNCCKACTYQKLL